MSRAIPKRFARPAGDLAPADEPDDLKGARLLGMLRHMVARNIWTVGITIGDAQFMVIRYRPEPAGPHNPAADLSGQEL